MKLSVLIPSRNELFLPQTVNDVFDKAVGDIEVIVYLDGYRPNPPLEQRKNLLVIHVNRAHGMRAAINAMASVASGDYLLKCDAHCMFAPGFDHDLIAHYYEDNWIVIPRRFSLDAEKWDIDHNGKPPRDYHYLCFPYPDKPHDSGMHGVEWWGRGKERCDPKYDIDETMSFQGSCWFMSKKHWDWLGGMSEAGYGPFTQEPQEIGNKTWLGGGKIMTNKKTWYAHLHKGKRWGRMWSGHEKMGIREGHLFSARYWMNNEWESRVHDMSWLIERFWPVPTWPEDRSLWVAP